MFAADCGRITGKPGVKPSTAFQSITSGWPTIRPPQALHIACHRAIGNETMSKICPGCVHYSFQKENNRDRSKPLFHQARDLRPHSDVERGIAAAFFGEEVQEVPLRHERHEAASCSKIRHITQEGRLPTDLGADWTDFLMRALQKLFKQTQLVHRFKRRGMNRVAAEIAQKIRVLLQNQDIDSCACEQEAQHHPSGAATSNTTPALQFLS